MSGRVQRAHPTQTRALPGHVVRAPGLHRLSVRPDRWCTADGEPVQDPETRRRLAALAVPPAWTHVWASAEPDAPVQATGIDRRGRTQYRYSTAARQAAAEHKFAEVLAFARVLPTLRARVQDDLVRRGTDDHVEVRRVVATAVRLLDRGLFRIGNDRYEQENHTYGLTTLLRDHVQVVGDRIVVDHVGKEHVRHHVVVDDHDAAVVVASLLRQERGPGEHLFAVPGPGGWRRVDSASVNSYLHAFGGRAVTAKVFRTWGATSAVVAVLAGAPVPDGIRVHRDPVLVAYEVAADLLGNTPEVARGAYVHPAAPLVGRHVAVRTVVAAALHDRPASGLEQVVRDVRFHEVVLRAFAECAESVEGGADPR